jgi:hypothetical protein
MRVSALNKGAQTSVSALKRGVEVGAETLRVAGRMRSEGSANSERGKRGERGAPSSTAVGHTCTTAEPDEHTPEPQTPHTSTTHVS